MLALSAGHAAAYAEIPSPKKQLEQGVEPEDIVCRHGMILMLRESGMPACVRPSTAERLEPKGWTVVRAADAPSDSVKTGQAAEEIQRIPASPSGVVSFYVVDQDLNRARNAAETVSTEGLLEITVNGIPIDAPSRMTETGFDTGRFLVRADLPETINGEPLRQDDVVRIRYLDESGHSGDPGILARSFALSSSYARVETVGESSRIGHEFTVRVYEPDANTDSRDEDKIPLSSLEYRGEGGIRTTLANPGFDANSGHMIETGPNTGTFEAKIKIPRELDGRTVHIGDWYEIRYVDRSTPSGTEEKIIFEGRIGR